MLITRIELENIKSYRHLTVDFRRGTTAISGANGAGKTTLVEAIGYALFNYLPYNQNQFVREGEKSGKVVIHLVGSDDRPYEVERRCGAGAHWLVYDREADHRVEQRTDVLDKLHELFGIDRERPLENLFRDALGVPQGTFTAIFLEAAAKRKQTFDALLQIEDYKTAFDYLLEVRKQYEEQIQEQKGEIQRFEIETRELSDWRIALKNARQEDEQKKIQNVQSNQRLATCKERSELLKQRRDNLHRSQSHHAQQKTIHNAAQQLLSNSQKSVSEAQAAQHAVENSKSDYERYLQADARLQQLRRDERQRNALQQQHNDFNNALATVQANIHNLHTRLREVNTARQRVVELAPLLEQQYALENQRDMLKQQVTQYDRLVKEVKRLDSQQTTSLQELAKIQRHIADIEPLLPLAEKLNERLEKVSRLQAKLDERGSKRLQFEDKKQQLQEKLEEREQFATKLRQAEDFLTKLEEHRQEAEELPELQNQYDELTAQQHRLEGNIEGYKRSRKLSAGGQCPLLYEPCQNIKARGLVSLEFYFDAELKKDHEILATLTNQLTTVTERMKSVKRYADELSKMGHYVDRRDGFVERLKQAAQDITRLEREVNDLKDDLDALKLIDQQIVQAKSELEESQKADQQVRMLDGMYQKVQHLQTLLEQIANDIEERTHLASGLRDSQAQLDQVQQQLHALNDPRSDSKAQQEIIKHEASYQQQLQEQQQKRQEIEQQLQALQQELQRYIDLDTHIGEQEAVRQMCIANYNIYLKNQDAARQLPEREQTHQKALREAEQAERDLLAAEQAFIEAQTVFNEQELTAVEKEINDLYGELSALAESMRKLQLEINGLTQKIEHAEALLVQLEAAEKEKRTLEDLQRMLEQFRKLIRDAAPHVLKALLNDISSEANRIFGEIMGDRSAQLTWENDYEIVLRRQGVNRTFAQLSGGEQMSAALAVRLALLKKLSTLNVAFFDEPTQNMDELRRTNLAEQIRRVRGFDQLFVISHDDTFEQSLDSLVRLRKKDGETLLVSDEEVMMGEEQVKVYAS